MPVLRRCVLSTVMTNDGLKGAGLPELSQVGARVCVPAIEVGLPGKEGRRSGTREEDRRVREGAAISRVVERQKQTEIFRDRGFDHICF